MDSRDALAKVFEVGACLLRSQGSAIHSLQAHLIQEVRQVIGELRILCKKLIRRLSAGILGAASGRVMSRSVTVAGAGAR